MNYTYLHYEIGLTLLNGIGPRRAKLLLDKFKTADEVFNVSKKEFCVTTGFNSNLYERLGLGFALNQAEKIMRENEHIDVETISWNDPKYPRRLKQCEDAPLILYKRGAYDLNEGQYVAIVGTRDSSKYGKQIVNDFTEEIKDHPITIVSGLATGIDTIAHQKAIEQNLPTIAVLGHGLDRIYPSVNQGLAKRIESHGALITEFTPWSRPDRENFPKRNRIVAGISDATVVVESRSKGGSLITAELANDYNRDVFAFPGDISIDRSKGCNKLIAAQKAHLITCGDDFLKIMNWNDSKKKIGKQTSVFNDLSHVQLLILNKLDGDGTAIDVLSYRTKLSVSQLNVELLHLEMNGLVRLHPGKKYSSI